MARKERRSERKRAAAGKRAVAPVPPVRPAPAPAASPASAALLRQASAHYGAGRPAAALEICREVLAREPNRPDVLSFAGMIAVQLGALEEAIGHYRKALALKPELVEVQYNLGLALERSGAHAAAADAYRAALARRPELVPAWHNLGNALFALGRTEEAVAAYERALALRPNAESARSLGLALERLGRREGAIAAYARALALRPGWPTASSNLANACFAQGEMAAALEACEAWLAAAPASIEASALKALALNELGAREAAAVLYDFARLVQVRDLAAPAGYASLAEFNTALVRHVEAHPSLKVPPADHPTYHHPALEITEELFAEPRGPMAAFETLVRDAIAAYRASVAPEPPHPFLAHFPREWRLTSWATRLSGWGNLVPHVHYDGYLGGVYYPLLPEIVAAEDQGEAGWFELGRPPAELNLKAAPLVRRIQPKEGRLLLFPGYMYHGTVPFTSEERRISIAFDLVALG
ncbi:MAG TPA: tetratricopeptide repeat protein [Alphaproteobacteria bacterium]|nr:tetratricopeptide repeat protein [Alphaproteobacteria bacterium]